MCRNLIHYTRTHVCGLLIFTQIKDQGIHSAWTPCFDANVRSNNNMKYIFHSTFTFKSDPLMFSISVYRIVLSNLRGKTCFLDQSGGNHYLNLKKKKKIIYRMVSAIFDIYSVSSDADVYTFINPQSFLKYVIQYDRL